uniref:AAA+ ATPase domain-containing protein n=1 Tax=Panagrolaimus sp. JU765 TaxID=591449 RepID=A0AC34RK05_9BILA
MGKSRLKRKMAPIVIDDDNPSPKCSRIDEGTEFVEDLHFESAKLLVDLLTDKNLVFVEGSIGCGKTTLVKRVAKQLDLPVKIIHLSDQIDSKTFLGNYQCTEVPGEFIWEASEFSQAITEKCLILLEDLDCASPDLVSSLMLMVKSWGISVRNDGQFTAFHENMRIVATVRSENSHGESSELIRSNPLSIQLAKLTVDELKKIVECKFPKLVKISDKLLKIYADCCEKMNEDNLIDRELNTSDLIRVCKRINKLTDLNDNNRLFMEFAEVFVLSLSSTKKRFEVAAIIGGHLSIPDDRVNFYLYKKSADIEPGTSIVRFGRTVLPVKKGEHVDSLSTKNFGLTSDARLLMERIAISIENDEPILLTGETGVG